MSPQMFQILYFVFKMKVKLLDESLNDFYHHQVCQFAQYFCASAIAARKMNLT